MDFKISITIRTQCKIPSNINNTFRILLFSIEHRTGTFKLVTYGLYNLWTFLMYGNVTITGDNIFRVVNITIHFSKQDEPEPLCYQDKLMLEEVIS